MTYAMKAFDTPEGRLELEFDFIPAEPTPAQLGEMVTHDCDTCAFKGLCHKGIPAEGEACSEWTIGFDAYHMAELAYYKALHKEHYG